MPAGRDSSTTSAAADISERPDVAKALQALHAIYEVQIVPADSPCQHSSGIRGILKPQTCPIRKKQQSITGRTDTSI